MPSFSSRFSRTTPGRSMSTMNRLMPSWPGVGVGLGDEHDEVGAVAVGDVGLRAVDDPLVAVAHGARADAGDVGAGVGLGDPEAGDLRRPRSPARGSAASAPRCRTRGSAASPCRCAPRRPSPARRSPSASSPRRARGCRSSRRPGRRTPRDRRARAGRARPCARTPSRGTSSPPTPRRAARAPWSRRRGSTRAARSCSSVKMKWRREAAKSGLRTSAAGVLMKVDSRTSHFRWQPRPPALRAIPASGAAAARAACRAARAPALSVPVSTHVARLPRALERFSDRGTDLCSFTLTRIVGSARAAIENFFEPSVLPRRLSRTPCRCRRRPRRRRTSTRSCDAAACGRAAEPLADLDAADACFAPPASCRRAAPAPGCPGPGCP